jgi:hypothetical protein
VPYGAAPSPALQVLHENLRRTNKIGVVVTRVKIGRTTLLAAARWRASSVRHVWCSIGLERDELEPSMVREEKGLML